MSQSLTKTHVAVVGAGPGGYAAAFKAADLGMQVTLIDPESNPGGVCLYRGCIPSKSLLHVAKLINETHEMANCGIKFGKPKINFDQLRQWTGNVVEKLTGGLGQLSKVRQIRYIRGMAQFVDSHRLNVAFSNKKEEQLKVDYTIVATGSSPTKISSLSLSSPRVMDSREALKLSEIPRRLLVIGGGYIGLELGTVYSALGSDVTVVEMTPGLLPGVDRDLVSILDGQLRKRSIDIMLNAKVTAMKATRGGVRVKFENDNKKATEETYQKVLVAVGRVPNSSGLGLEHTAVELDPKGFIQIDEQRRTGDKAIFAIGDVAGEPMLAHKATHEGIIAAEAIAGAKSAFEPQAIPAVVFTDPEIAWCGLTETEAKKRNQLVTVTKFPWGASGRATTIARNDGMTKLIVDPESGRILGVGICGTNAGDLIAEGALAIEMAALANDVKLTIHPHPTLSETIMESAEMFSGASTHVFRPPRKNVVEK